MNVTVSRRAHFNAAHRLHRPDWSTEKNVAVFGKCNNPNFHGHNYEMVVSVTGKIDPETGYVVDVKILKDFIKSEVEEAFDHKNLNLDVPEFKNLNPTAENIVVVIYNKLKAVLEPHLALEVTLYETPRNFVSYSGS
ncbi:MAG: 6-pyruvoyl trahydropterin synthase family protein [Flavobacteriaceae bacterium]|jgi:6-pyruvoyltetrahydropterin/6-carboxytetrahydropterin synthase|nr:6-carboxytetrahydropterin synthase [Flavobacteriaceae bacterium]MDC0635370.1 6-carboxytetrahydropterin synthase [Flavobacteriaceae bacterium]MDC3300776.1 6-carboxytetrahydropterin synthase [Flavobacteriaceae bacterium]CAI8153727.1 MAG: 6-carboxy-5,6,7,8-tetrahydropterin synthase [Formosa sp. Hel3_A1_48]